MPATIKLFSISSELKARVILLYFIVLCLSLAMSLIFIAFTLVEQDMTKPIFIIDVIFRGISLILVFIAFIIFSKNIYRHNKSFLEHAFPRDYNKTRDNVSYAQFLILIFLVLFLIGPGFGVFFTFHYGFNFKHWHDFTSDNSSTFNKDIWIINPVQDTFINDAFGQISEVLTPLTYCSFLFCSCSLLTLLATHNKKSESEPEKNKNKRDKSSSSSTSLVVYLFIALFVFYTGFMITIAFVLDVVPSAVPLVHIIPLIVTCTLDPRDLEFNGMNLFNYTLPNGERVISNTTTNFCTDIKIVRQRVICQVILLFLEVVFVVGVAWLGKRWAKDVRDQRLKNNLESKQGFFYYSTFCTLSIGFISLQSFVYVCGAFIKPEIWIVTFNNGELAVDPLRVSGVPLEFLGMSAQCFVFTAFLLLVAYLYSPVPKSSSNDDTKPSNLEFEGTESEGCTLRDQINHMENRVKSKDKDDKKESVMIVAETVRTMLKHSNLAYTVSDGTSNKLMTSKKRLKLKYKEDHRAENNVKCYDIASCDGRNDDVYEVKENIKHYISTDTNAKDSHCVISTGEDRIIVALRGTVSAVNWLTNIRIAQVPLFHKELKPELKKVKVHNGFLQALDTKSSCYNCCSKKTNEEVAYTNLYIMAERKIEMLLKEHKNNTNDPKAVVFTGHSLGGALAQIFAYFFRSRHEEFKIACFTYAAPRPGNHLFKRQYEKTVPATWRFELTRDTVPTIPWSCYCLKLCNSSYHHAGSLVLMDHVYGINLVNPVCSDLFVHQNLRCFIGSCLTEHKLETYLLAFESWEDQLKRPASPSIQEESNEVNGKKNSNSAGSSREKHLEGVYRQLDFKYLLVHDPHDPEQPQIPGLQADSEVFHINLEKHKSLRLTFA